MLSEGLPKVLIMKALSTAFFFEIKGKILRQNNIVNLLAVFLAPIFAAVVICISRHHEVKAVSPKHLANWPRVIIIWIMPGNTLTNWHGLFDCTICFTSNSSVSSH